MIDVKVTIEGPGGTLDPEVNLIIETLRNAGYNVKLSNNDYREVPGSIRPQEQKQHFSIDVNVIEHPWGG